MADDAVKAVQAGYHHLKLKVGIDSTVDFERVAAIRKAVGKDIAIRLDANQGWNPRKPFASSAPWKMPIFLLNLSNSL